MKKVFKKKVFIVIVVFLIVAISVIGAVLYSVPRNMHGTYVDNQPVDVSDVIMSNTTSFTVPLSVTSEEPTQQQERKLYDVEGNEIRLIRETGQLVNSNGELLYEKNTLGQIMYNEVTQEIFDGANKSIEYWWNSKTMQYCIGSDGGKNISTIKIGDNVYIGTIQDPKDKLVKTMYIIRDRVEKPWSLWNYLNPNGSTWYYAYKDLNGREIPDYWFVEHERASWFRQLSFAMGLSMAVAGGAMLGGIKGALIAGTVYYAVDVFIAFWKGRDPKSFATLFCVKCSWDGVETVIGLDNNCPRCGEITTYHDVLEHTEDILKWFAHPWERIEGVYASDEDGEYTSAILINPINDQLTDWKGDPLYSLSTGEPLIYFNQALVSIPSGEVQKIQNGCLIGVATKEFLQKLNFDVYIHYIDSEDINETINILVMRYGDKWYLPNMDSADGIIRDGVGVIDYSEDGKFSWLNLWNDTVGQIFPSLDNSFNDFAQIISIIFLVLLLVLLLPVLIPIITFFLSLINMFLSSVFTLFKPRNKGGDK